jgi:2-polyprenyl-6-methoxyphenol hydroxylase-like FAD-dependent oxidoreductase
MLSIVIVGAGPVGLCTALLLRRKLPESVAIVVTERECDQIGELQSASSGRNVNVTLWYAMNKRIAEHEGLSTDRTFCPDQ